MKSRRLLLGIATGFGFGYIAMRAVNAAAGRAKNAGSGGAPEYAALRRRLAVGGTVRSLFDAYAFAYGPAGAALDAFASRAPAWAAPGIFATTALALQQVVEAPVAYVEDWGIERSFGLSDQEARSWWIDYAKGSALSVAVGGVLATLAGFGVRAMPKRWPVAAAIATLPLLVLANVIVPLYVLPLFNSFEALDGPLEERLRALAARFGVGDAEILRMNMSRQTKKANAFVTGVFHTHRIVLGDTLIESFTPAEIEFVVAHELGHYVMHDTWRLIALSQTAATLTFFFSNRMLRDEDRRRPLFLARTLAAAGLAATVARPALLAFSRSREWAADRFALDATGDAQAGAHAFRRLRDQNKAEDDVPSWYQFMYGSHPSLGERIAALDVR